MKIIKEFRLIRQHIKYLVTLDDERVWLVRRIKKDGTCGAMMSHDGEIYKELVARAKKRSRVKKPESKPSLSEVLSGKKKSKPSIPHLIVKARAGTGKTTTLIEGLKIMKCQKSPFIPSQQQQAIWDSMMLSKDAKTICFVAFNKSIAMELQDRVPEGCNAMTMHSLGFKAVAKSCRLNPHPNNVQPNRVSDITIDLLGCENRWDANKKFPNVLKNTKTLVDLCKMNLLNGNFQDLDYLVGHHDIEMNGSRSKVFSLVPQVLERCKKVERDGCIDYADMIWLPIILNLPLFVYDLLLVDECQDLNRCQQALAKKVGRRLILVGDEKQAIYGFAGADSESMNRMEDELKISKGCEILPLTVTRRCGKAIVKEAQKLVPDFEAHESNCEGKIWSACYNHEGVEFPIRAQYQGYVKDNDMILCRCNAPLVSECLKFIRAGKKAQIQGREIGRTLVATIDKMQATTMIELKSALSVWLELEMESENKKKNPRESYMINLQDRHDCLQQFAEDAGLSATVDSIKEKITRIFTDDKENPGIRLSSIHKAKGLEADRVFLLEPEGATVPHPMARTDWQQEQENHLKYIAITRAIKEFVYVS